MEFFIHESKNNPTELDYFKNYIDLPTIKDLGGLGVASSGTLMLENNIGYGPLGSYETLTDAAVLDMQQRFCDEYGILPIQSRSLSSDRLSIATSYANHETVPTVNLYAQDEAEYDSGVFNVRGWASRCVVMTGLLRLKNQGELGQVGGHEEEALRYISKAAFDHRINVRWEDFMPLFEHASVELLRTIVGQGDGYTLPRLQQVLPPDFTLDQACIDGMLRNTKMPPLFEWIDKIDPTVSLQDIVDRMATRDNAYTIVKNIDQLPQEIMIPIVCVEDAVRSGYIKEAIELVRANRVRYPDKQTLVNMLFKYAKTINLVFELGLMDGMGRDDIEELITEGNLSIDSLLIHAETIMTAIDVDWLKERMKEHLDGIHYVSIAKMSQPIQSMLFDVYYEKTPTDLGGIIEYFSHLRGDQYSLLLDRYSATLKNYPVYELVNDVFSNASQAIRERLEQEVRPIYIAREKMASETHEQNTYRKERRSAELSYFNDNSSYRIDVHGYDEQLNDEQVVAGLEREHCVKRVAPIHFQAADMTREGLIECVTNRMYGVGTDGETVKRGGGDVVKIAEHEAIAQYICTMQRLKQLAKESRSPDEAYMHDLIENLTFIGEPEYEEAVRGIAIYWKHLLDENPALQLYVVKGAITNGYKTKSDEYMFDRILAHFSNEDMARYKGRLIINPNDIVGNDPQNIRTILLDDWTISGSQLRGAANNFLATFPHLMSTLEIQLIAATEERVALGLEMINARDDTHNITIEEAPITIKAYYMANRLEGSGDANIHGGLITGAHSAVDYGFESIIARVCLRHGISMPPLTNIIRPYRMNGYTLRNFKRYVEVG